MKVLSHYLPLLLLTSLAACKKDNSLSGNLPQNGATVAFHLKASQPTTTINRIGSGPDSASGSAAASLEWTSGTAFVSRIKFEGKNNGNKVEFKSNVNREVDIFSIANSIGNLAIPPGSYKEVEFKAELSADGGQPALELKGRFINGTVGVPVDFIANESITVKGEKANVVLNDSILHQAVTSLNLAALTRGISAQNLRGAVLTSNELVISSSVNQEIYKAIVNNIKELGGEEDFE